jgi:hypothetical protein
MQPNKIACAPIYIEPEQMREKASNALKALKHCGQWIDDSTLLLNEVGSFSHKAMEDDSFKVRTQKASFFLANLVSPPGYTVKPEEQRVYIGGRRLLISLVAHAWLWARPEVLDSKGNPVNVEKRRVLAPQEILDFLGSLRPCKDGCTYDKISSFVESLSVVSVHGDTSKWNLTGVIACLKWDKAHDLHNGGPWCSCRLRKKKNFPPSYHDIYTTQRRMGGVVHRFRHWLIHGPTKDRKRSAYEPSEKVPEYSYTLEKAA